MRPATYRAFVVCAAVLAVALGAVPGAQAFIYWPNSSATTIVRANLDGTGVQPLVSTPGGACGVAVDSAHIYWSSLNGNLVGGGSIGRANLDGSAPDQNFITGASNPCGVAVDGAHVYWANNVSGGSIGRANLDGSAPNQSIVSPMDHPCGVAVDGSHLYWGNRGSGTTAGDGAIGRASLDGSAPEQGFIMGATHPCGVAVDGAHVYWSNLSGGTTIGRANLDGGIPDENFITGAFHPCGVAVDGFHLYWANTGATPGIGRANLDGTFASQGFIPGVNSCFVAVDALPLPPVSPPPVSPPPAGPPVATPVPQPVIPKVGSLQILPNALIAASRGPSATVSRSRRLSSRTGAKVSYTLNIAATVRFTVEQRLPGRRSGSGPAGRCVAPTSANRDATRCTLVVKLRGSFTQSAGAGANAFHFTGRLAGAALKPGTYHLVAAPRAGAVTGPPTTATLRVKP